MDGGGRLPGRRGPRHHAHAPWRRAKEVFPRANFDIENQEWQVYLYTLKRDTPVEEMPHVWMAVWAAGNADQNNWVHEVFNAEEDMNRPRAAPCRFEELTKQAQIETDPEKRKALYLDAERFLVGLEARIAPICHYGHVKVVKPFS